jgi:hypothetical protein
MLLLPLNFKEGNRQFKNLTELSWIFSKPFTKTFYLNSQFMGGRLIFTILRWKLFESGVLYKKIKSALFMLPFRS